MGRGKEGGDDVEVPADEDRCARNDGKGWRCKKPKFEDFKMCFYHLPLSAKNKVSLTPKSEKRGIKSEKKDIVYTRTKRRKPREQLMVEKNGDESGENSEDEAAKKSGKRALKIRNISEMGRE